MLWGFLPDDEADNVDDLVTRGERVFCALALLVVVVILRGCVG